MQKLVVCRRGSWRGSEPLGGDLGTSWSVLAFFVAGVCACGCCCRCCWYVVDVNVVAVAAAITIVGGVVDGVCVLQMCASFVFSLLSELLYSALKPSFLMHRSA